MLVLLRVLMPDSSLLRFAAEGIFVEGPIPVPAWNLCVLTHNVITKGRYYKAAEEIPDEELSPNLLKYVGTNGYQEEIQQQRRDADSIPRVPMNGSFLRGAMSNGMIPPSVPTRLRQYPENFSIVAI